MKFRIKTGFEINRYRPLNYRQKFFYTFKFILAGFLLLALGYVFRDSWGNPKKVISGAIVIIIVSFLRLIYTYVRWKVEKRNQDKKD